MMRFTWLWILAAFLVTGCSSARRSTDTAQSSARTQPRNSRSGISSPVLEIQKPHETLIDEPNGKVVSVNTVSRFVVIDFYLSPMPQIGERMNVYRDGFKVGEVRITGPEQFSNIAADLLAGGARTGDEVRTQ